RALEKDFMTDLQVRDEGNYWESHDTAALRTTFEKVQGVIDGLAEGLSRHALTPEATESPEIVADRIERVTQLVHRTLSRPAEHAPVELESDACDPGGALDGSEADWDEQFKQNRRKQERIQRAIEERVGRGEDPEGAFQAAMGDEGIIDLPDEPSEEDDDWD